MTMKPNEKLMSSSGNYGQLSRGRVAKIQHSKSMLDVVDLRMTRPPEGLRPVNVMRRAASTAPAAAIASQSSNDIRHSATSDSRRHTDNPTTAGASTADFSSFTIKSTQYNKKTAPSAEADDMGTIDLDDDENSPERLKAKRSQAMMKNFCSPLNGSVLTDIALKQYGIDSGEKVTNGTVQELCTIQPYMTRLDLTDCKEVSDVGLWAIARHSLKLHTLVLAGTDYSPYTHILFQLCAIDLSRRLKRSPFIRLHFFLFSVFPLIRNDLYSVCVSVCPSVSLMD